MKVWKRVRFLKKDKKIDMIVKSYVNYIYQNSPMTEIINKYHIYYDSLINILKAIIKYKYIKWYYFYFTLQRPNLSIY